MSIGLLTNAQVAAIKSYRQKAWTRSFTIRTYPDQEVTDLYDDPAGAPTDVTAAGDWRWQPQERDTGSTGGPIKEGFLFLCTNLVYSGTLMDPRVRLIVDGRYVAPKHVAPVPDFGEVVVQGVVVHG